MNNDVKYESKFSIYPFIAYSFGILFGGIVGLLLLKTFIEKGDFSFVILLPISFISLSLLSVYGLFTLKTIIITKECLLFSYLFFRKTIKIQWNSISDVRKKFVTLKTDVDSNVYRKGIEIKIFSEVGKLNVSSFLYSNFNEFSNQFEPRIDPKIRKKINYDYKETKDKFGRNEKRYKEIRSKYIIPISIVFLIIIWLWLK